jgi:hypothetical protein
MVHERQSVTFVAFSLVHLLQFFTSLSHFINGLCSRTTFHSLVLVF